jgi:anti-sigma regulatory factor (Ser/Thr protein kinase)
MVRVGRLTASSIASIADMSIDDIDDVKIAVSEMITLLIQSGNRSAITMRFEIDGESFIIEASTPAAALDLGRNDVALATAVLQAVADSHEVAFVDDRILMRVVKTTVAS